MVAIVYQKDNRSGVTYAYESVSHWNKEKKQSRAKRTLIGKLDEKTGVIVPTDGRGKKRNNVNKSEREELSTQDKSVTRKFYGATYLFDQISKKIGIEADLKKCFPDNYKQLLSIAYYLILEDSNPLYRFEKWNFLHKHPFGEHISSQRSSEIFSSITEASKKDFFRLQGKRRMEKEYWAYDTTSISSYSEMLRQVQFGHNKEDDRLPQINLALVFGEKSNLPFYYRALAGNTPDSKTLENLLEDLKDLNISKLKIVMDRGFYSEKNINNLYKDHVKFLISSKLNTKFIRKELDSIIDNFRSFENFNEDYELYSRTVTSKWNYSQSRPNKGDVLKLEKRIYIHYYYNIDKAAEDEKAFDRKIVSLRKEIETNKRISTNEKLYKKYFEIKSTPKRGIKATVKQDAVEQQKKYYGYFALISNETMDSITALEIYRNKDVVEKAFGNLKERLNMRRTLVSSEQSLSGKLFVEFIALIFLSYIKKQMQEKKLFKDYTLQGVFDKLDVIECFEQSGKKLRFGEILEKQTQLYKDLGVEPPSSL